MAKTLDKTKTRLAITPPEVRSTDGTHKASADVLNRSEKRFRDLIENNADAILVIDTSGVVRFANPATMSVFGRPREALNGQQFGFPIGGKSATTIEVIDAAGSVRTVEMRVADTDWDGRKAYLATLRDISLQITTNRRLAESENKFRALFKNSRDAICFIARDGRILDCNQASETVLGHPLRGLKKMSWSDLYKDPADFVFFQLKIETHGSVKDYPLEIVTRRGSLRTCLITAALVQSDQDGTIGYQGIVRDMTELIAHRQNLETLVARRTLELNRSLVETEYAKQRIDGIIASVGDGLIVTDARHRVELINPAAEAMLSLRATEVIGQPIAAVAMLEELREHLMTCLDKMVGCRRHEFNIPSDNASPPRNIRALTAELPGVGGAVSGTVTLLSDVTYEHEITRMKNEIISTVAHELRTPLTSICGFSEILLTRDDLEDNEKQRFLKYIFEQAKVLAIIINDLLDLSRIEAGSDFPVNRQVHDITDMVRGVAERFQLETVRHTFFLDLPSEALPVSCDRGKIERVLDNLYSNAVKYSPDGGIIETVLHLDNGEVDLSVKDNGIGMSPDQVDRVFEKFYRADASNTAIAGTGLGMSIVHHIIETHSGRIEVHSRKDIGTTVSIRLPVEACSASENQAGDTDGYQQLPLWGIKV